MSNASLKDQLQAVAAQLSETLVKTHKPKRSKQKHLSADKPVEKKINRQSPSKPKPKWLLYVQYGVELLRAYFPQTFKSGNDVQPLKKGIKQDLIKALSVLDQVTTDDKACMVKSLSYYVNTAAYHRKVLEGAVRIDLDGNAFGIVSAEEAKYSSERVQIKQQAKQAKLMSAPLPQQKAEVSSN